MTQAEHADHAEHAAIAEQLRQLREQRAKLPASDVVAEAAAELITFASLRLGLPREQNQAYRDLDAARLLIDALGGLLQATEGRLGPHEQELRQALADLRLSFAAEVGKEQAPGQPSPQAGDERQERQERQEGSRLHRPPSGLWVPGQP